MHRFFLAPEQCGGPILELSGREAHHALQVLRIRRGELVQVLDGAGQVLSCKMHTCDRRRVQLEVIEREVAPPRAYGVTLLQGLPKGKLIDAIIQKSTELGAERIVPLLTERVVVHLDGEEASAKAERWRGLAVEAVKQCGSAWLPQVEPPAPFTQWLDCDKAELRLFGLLAPEACHPRQHFLAFRRQHQRLPRSVSAWIGPEGDFSPAEIGELKSAGVLPITLGPLVLRTETAAVYCLSFINYELQAPP